MTGVPIYLVSACTTGEEFVAAFRRYADRGSLFVPIAEPIPTGRRGRFAVTLTSGGVMLEGDGEVISSAKTPSILHGRIGMTIRFAELDDASKTVLIELEKARLATQPVAPSVAPRAADVPAAPRAKPPAVTARIDAHTALAECVAIGDVDALVTSAAAPPKAGPKFVMPAVLPVGQRPKTPSGPQPIVTRPKTPSAPPPLAARPKTPSIPPAMPSLPVPVAMPPSKSGPIAGSVPVAIGPTKSGPIAGSVPVAIGPSKSGPIAGSPPKARPLTGEGPTAVTSPIVPPDKPAQIMAAVSVTPTPTEMAAVDLASSSLTVTAPMPVVAIKHTRDDETRPSPIRVAAAARREDPTPAKPIRVTPPAMPAQRVTPPLPIKPPIVGTAPDRKVLVSDLDETTDVTTMPAPGPDDPGTGRRTTLGVAVSPGGMVLPAVIADAEEAKPTEVVEAQHAPISNKQPTVEEPTPSGDWTITPGADGPVIQPRPASHEPRPARDSKPGDEETPVVQQDIPLPTGKPRRQTGDWTIQLDSDSPDGWSEPAKVDKLPPVIVEPPKPKARPKQAENPPELAPVARSIMVESQIEPKPQPAVVSDEPKIQIDPTLMEAPIVDLARVDLAVPAPPEARPRIATPMPMAAVQVGQEIGPSARPRLPTPVPGMPAVAPEMPIEMLVPMGMGVELPPGVAMVPELERPGLGTGGSPALQQDLVDVPVGTPDPRITTPVPGAMRLPTPLPMPMPTPAPGAMRATPLPQMSRDQMAAMINPAARGLTDGGTGFFRESGEIANLSGSFAMIDTAAARSRRTRIIVIAVSAALVLAIGIGLLLTLGGDKKSDEPVAVPPPAVDAPAAVVMIDAADITAPTVDAAEVKPPPPPEQCTVEVTSVPPAADIVDEANATLGTTPATLPLPCGKEVKLTIKKLRYAMTVRPVTATAEGAKLRVLLQKLMFQIKVSSQPAGASVSLNGKAGAAITPSVMKVPAFDTSTVTFTKDGYEPMAVKVQAKQNNQTVHAQLKKKKK